MMIRYGGFWRRFAAISIDSIILDLFTVIIYLTGISLVPMDGGFSYTTVIPYYGMAILLNAAYFIYFHGTTGQTPGKRLLGLKVIRVEGTPVTPGIAFLRWVGYLVSKVPLLLGFIWAVFDDRKQGWHDKIAGTCVIRTMTYQRITDRIPPETNPSPDRGHTPVEIGFPYGGNGENT